MTRRTWLAAERTWLAWWRTGIGAAAVALAVGRLLPATVASEHTELRVLGLGWGLLAIAVLVLGGWRQHRTADKLRRGSFEPLSSSLVACLTAAAVIIAFGTLAVIAVRL